MVIGVTAGEEPLSAAALASTARPLPLVPDALSSVLPAVRQSTQR